MANRNTTPKMRRDWVFRYENVISLTAKRLIVVIKDLNTAEEEILSWKELFEAQAQLLVRYRTHNQRGIGKVVDRVTAAKTKLGI